MISQIHTQQIVSPSQEMMEEQVKPNTLNPPHHKLKPNIESKLSALLKEYASRFAKDEMAMGKTPLTEMTIATGTSEPVKEEIEKCLMAKVICSSRSSWSALIIVVPKGDRGK